MSDVVLDANFKQDVPPLSGGQLFITAFLLALANFIVILDMTVANVSIAHIAGSLAISTTEGTYVITSYAVAEAISVPLTGWLSKRFGILRVFTTCMFLFGFFSMVCGASTTLSMLVMGRICQGFVGGPLMPLSQTLLMSIFPKDQQHTAIGLSAMTTLIAPVMGPILGGYICDNWHWSGIFFINIPVALICGMIIAKQLKLYETARIMEKVDVIGLSLMIVWVVALQLMLDKGKELDWFSSNFIIILAIITVTGFISFLIWEVTSDNPIVDLKIFRHRGYTVAVTTISLTFGAYFGSIVLTPLWLQTTLGYTATWSGLTTAASGILAIFAAPLAAMLSKKVDSRLLISFGIAWLGFITFWRSFATPDMTQQEIFFLLLIQGIGLPFFFVPLTGLALTCVEKHEMANAAGLMSFSRTLSGAIATSVITTSWENQTTAIRSELSSLVISAENFYQQFHTNSVDFSLNLLDSLVQLQSLTISCNRIYLVSSGLLFLASLGIWLVKRQN